MFWNQSDEEILNQWWIEVAHSVETGQAPLLNLGEARDLLETEAARTALNRFLQSRNDTTVPHLLRGGAHPLWLETLQATFTSVVQSAEPTSSQPSQQSTYPSNRIYPVNLSTVNLSYSGADPATIALTPSLLGGHERNRLFHWQDVKPRLHREQFAPAAQPAAPPGWESLPLLLAEQFTWTPPEVESQDWIAWSAVALVVIIVVLSFLV